MVVDVILLSTLHDNIASGYENYIQVLVAGVQADFTEVTSENKLRFK